MVQAWLKAQADYMRAVLDAAPCAPFPGQDGCIWPW
jgi:hypothetical protein